MAKEAGVSLTVETKNLLLESQPTFTTFKLSWIAPAPLFPRVVAHILLSGAALPLASVVTNARVGTSFARSLTNERVFDADAVVVSLRRGGGLWVLLVVTAVVDTTGVVVHGCRPR